jgi:RND family efflux transporter MFP subunit
LRISAEVDEEDIAGVKPGQEVLIRADAFPGKVFHGRVQSITPKGDPVARSYRVRIKFTEDTPLQIGMTAEINIIISEHQDALLLPNSAVMRNNQVWLVKGGRLAGQTVETGAKGPEQTEILSGVTMEDQAVLKPKPEMMPGQKVRASLVPQAP